MTLDQILNLAERLAIYSGFQSSTVDVTILPEEADFLSKMLKTTIGGRLPAIPDGNYWSTGLPPVDGHPDGDMIIFMSSSRDVDTAKYDEENNKWHATNMDDPEDDCVCWRPFDAPV